MKVPTVCCRTNGEVERVARRVVKASDRVIEIGSALGSLTAALRDLVGGDDGRGGRVFAFDVRRKLAVAGGGARTAKYRSTTEMTGVAFTELPGNSAVEICSTVMAAVAAGRARSAAQVPSSAKRRVSIPVRLTIHSWVVSMP